MKSDCSKKWYVFPKFYGKFDEVSKISEIFQIFHKYHVSKHLFIAKLSSNFSSKHTIYPPPFSAFAVPG